VIRRVSTEDDFTLRGIQHMLMGGVVCFYTGELGDHEVAMSGQGLFLGKECAGFGMISRAHRLT